MAKRQILVGLVLAAGCIVLPGCAATYQVPAGSPAAIRVIARGDSPLLLSHTVTFDVYDDQACNRHLGTLGMIGFLAPEPKAVSVPAGVRLFLRANSFGNDPAVRFACANLVSVNLTPNGTYEFTHHVLDNGRKCRLAAVARSQDRAGEVLPLSARGKCSPRL